MYACIACMHVSIIMYVYIDVCVYVCVCARVYSQLIFGINNQIVGLLGGLGPVVWNCRHEIVQKTFGAC